MARGTAPLLACAIGNGGTDAIFATPIAESPYDTGLRNQIFFSPSINTIREIGPPDSEIPRIEVVHTFYSRNVVPNGTAITYIDEFGIFAKDPDTQLYVLVDRRTFDRLEFNVPASGPRGSRNVLTLKIALGMM
jgi:hypothetical protein